MQEDLLGYLLGALDGEEQADIMTARVGESPHSQPLSPKIRMKFGQVAGVCRPDFWGEGSLGFL